MGLQGIVLDHRRHTAGWLEEGSGFLLEVTSEEERTGVD